MAGLGLSNAVEQFQRGAAWRQQQDEMERQRQIREQINLANAAGAKVLADAKAAHDIEQARAIEQWAASGKPRDEFKATPWQPTPELLLQAADAKGAELARRGLWGEFTTNFAQFAPLRQQMRQKAYADLLSRYDANGDPVALAKGAWPLVHDGTDIVGHEVQDPPTPGLSEAATPALRESASGTPGYGASQASQADSKAAAGGRRYTFKLSDGSTIGPLTADQIREHVLNATLSPQQVMEYEFQKRLLAERRRQEAEAQREQDDRRHEYRMAEIGLSNAGRQEVADTRAEGSVRAARIRTAAGSGSGGGRGGGSSAGNSVQSVQTDADGYKILVFRDRNIPPQRLMIDGKPVRGESWAKRVDELARDLSKGNTDEELRAKAETMLIGKAIEAANAGASSAPAPAPAPGAAPKTLAKFLGFEN